MTKAVPRNGETKQRVCTNKPGPTGLNCQRNGAKKGAGVGSYCSYSQFVPYGPVFEVSSARYEQATSRKPAGMTPFSYLKRYHPLQTENGCSYYGCMLFLLLMSHILPAQRFLFLEWKHDERLIILGEMHGAAFKKLELCAKTIETLLPSDLDMWLEQEQNGRALLFFHAMWGQERRFMRKTLKNINNGIVPDTGFTTVITFIWHAGGIFYTQNWRKAAEKGEPLAPILSQINARFNGRVCVLCHSMGNRFFEGALRSYAAQDFNFQKAILFSPDLHNESNDPD
ncbi:MAG: alpha/beta hydrolase, partial [Thermoanaerobaculia bacterium]|nr:alpha/beta hydrolase [Thermoanaerobaculia bacterium]